MGRDRDETFPEFPETETFKNRISRPSRDRDIETETTSLIIICVLGDGLVLDLMAFVAIANGNGLGISRPRLDRFDRWLIDCINY